MEHEIKLSLTILSINITSQRELPISSFKKIHFRTVWPLCLIVIEVISKIGLLRYFKYFKFYFNFKYYFLWRGSLKISFSTHGITNGKECKLGVTDML